MQKKFDHPTEMFESENGYLGYLLRIASHSYRLKMEKALQPFSITPPQFTVLKIISVYPGYTNAEIARFASLTPQTVNLMITKLVQFGVISKHAHPENKKVLCLKITSQGETLLEQVTVEINQLEENLELDFKQNEIKVIRKWLQHVINF